MTVGLVLLDRDGTLNVKAPEGEYVERPEDLVMLPGAAEAVRRLNEAGISVAVVTNQRGIALGRMTETDLEAVHRALRSALAREGAHLDAIHHCPHDRGTCSCRKPEPGMLLSAARDLGVAATDAVMVGDADSDVAAGLAAGARTVQLVEGSAAGHPGARLTVSDLTEAVDWILSEFGLD